MILFDAHLDLSMNAIDWNRDLTKELEEIRWVERDLTDKPDRGNGVVSLPSMREGNVALCAATLIARYAKPSHPLGGWRSPQQAWAQTEGQLEWYRSMELLGEMKLIRQASELTDHIAQWDPLQNASTPIGFVLSLEGADSLITLDHLYRRYDDGLRAIGPAHYGPGTYAFGTNSDGKLPPKGKELLQEMQRLNMILDVTHLCDECFWDAMDIYDGPIWASHSNCRSLVPNSRQFNDQQIQELIARGAVIGAAMDAWMLYPEWKRGVSDPQTCNVSLESVANHLDHICQLAGNALHVGIGSDLDGGFGKEQAPYDVESIADIQLISTILEDRGYTSMDIERIFHRNWVQFLQKAWS